MLSTANIISGDFMLTFEISIVSYKEAVKKGGQYG